MEIRRVIIIHGFADDPTRGWIGWLTRELRSRGIEVIAPAMPAPSRPDFAVWNGAIRDTIGQIDESTVLIGHSLGCFMLLRFLEQYEGKEDLGKLILVAGFIAPADPERRHYFEPEPDFTKIRARVGQIFSVYSDDDRVVLPSQSRTLNVRLDGQLVLDRDKGHFAGLRGIERLDSVLQLVLDNS